MRRTPMLGRTATMIAALGFALTGCSTAARPSTPTTSPSAAPTGPSAAPTAASAAPSPSIADLSGQIVFVDEQAPPKHAQIWVENANGTNLRQLVTSNFDDRTPAISPDGRRVLFTRYVPDGAPPDDGGVFVVNVDGTGLRHINTDGEDPSWSPDGLRLVETRDLFDPGAAAPYSVALWIQDLDGTGVHQITGKGMRCDKSSSCPDGYQDNQAHWSPDGKTLAFLRDVYTSPEHYEIVTASADGSNINVVTPQGMNVGNPTWSRDGSLILFQSPPEPGATQDLYTIKLDGSGLTQLTSHLSKDANGVQGVFHPSWSPDGSMIVFSHYPGASGTLASLYVIRADGTAMTLITHGGLNANGAEWGVLPTP